MLASSKVMDALKGIGLNLYERRLWVALLARGTSTAGELSGLANVPRSRTYDILQSLAEKGFVVVQTSKPIKYVAVSPSEAIDRAKKKLEEDLQVTLDKMDGLKESAVTNELNELHKKGMKLISPEDLTGALKGRYFVSQQINTMFKDANKKISIVTTKEGLNDLMKNHFDVLRKAKERGVDIRIAAALDRSFEVPKELVGISQIRSMNKKDLPLSGRFFITDGKEMLLSLTDSKSLHSSQQMAMWSKSEHAAGKVLEPLFNLVWSHSKPAK